MIESILSSLLGVVLIVAPVIPAFFIGFYTSLTFNVLFLYFLNRFLFPKVIYSNYFLKEYFLGILLVVIVFEIISFLIVPLDANIHLFVDKEDINNMSELEIVYHHFGSFNTIFLGLIYLKISIFYISWRIQGFIFKEQYKAYRIKDFVLSKPDNKGKHIGLYIGIFFTLTNIDILLFIINLQEEVFIPIYRLVELIYQYFLIDWAFRLLG